MRARTLSLVAAALVLATTTLHASGRVIAGPMLGYQEHREVLVFLETEGTERASLRYWPAEHPQQTREIAPRRTLANPIGTHVHHFVIDGLTPGLAYNYAVLLDGATQSFPHPLAFRAEAIWEWRGDPPTVRFLLGSCSFFNDPPYDRPVRPGRGPYGQSPVIYQAMTARGGDFMLWLGDNLYLREADWTSRYGIYYRYSFDRRQPELQPFLAAMHHYGTWDDHEFGPNDASRGYEMKDTTLEAFRWYWPMRSAGEVDNPGIYTRFVQGDAEFFLLDARYHRDDAYIDKVYNPDKSFLGRRQLEWLKSALSHSNEDENIQVRFIALGSQFLNPFPLFENLSRYPRERQEILEFIARNRINGVVFLTGDRHFSELSRLERDGMPPLLEFTASAITAGPNRRPETEGENWAEARNPVRVPGTIFVENNFGEVALSGPRLERTVTFRLFDREGKERWVRSYPVPSLQWARPAR